MATHIMIGTGLDADGGDLSANLTNRAVWDSLKDVMGPDDFLYVPYRGGKVPDSMAWVYDYVLDHELEAVFVHTDVKLPGAFTNSDHVVVQEVKSLGAGLRQFRSSDGKLIVYGEDEETELDLMDAWEEGTTVVDLADGLTEVLVDAPQGTAEEAPVPMEPEPESEPDPEDPRTDEPVLTITDGDDPTDEAPDDVPETISGMEALMRYQEEELAAMPVRSIKHALKTANVEFPASATHEELTQIVLATQRDANTETQVDVGATIVALCDNLKTFPSSRSIALTITHLETALLWYRFGSNIEE